jgi:hypothetical protein
MTTDERMERVEHGWLEIQQALKAVIQVQSNSNERIATLTESIGQYADAANARTSRLEENLAALTESIGQYADAANARTSRLEENLDALIRAITAEHSNGKSQH